MKKYATGYLIFLVIAGLIIYAIKQNTKKPMSADQQIEQDWNNVSSSNNSTSNIIWIKRPMSLISDDKKTHIIQIGLAPNGTFIWREEKNNSFSYK